jgi:hypothetical protein
VFTRNHISSLKLRRSRVSMDESIGQVDILARGKCSKGRALLNFKSLQAQEVQCRLRSKLVEEKDQRPNL